jgi:SH3-like domain-containing protein
MKKWILLAMLGITAIGGMSAQSLRGKTLYVAIKSAALKSSTGFFASTRTTLKLGDSVTVLQEKGKWVEVRAPSGSGWIASSSLSSKRIIAAGATSASAGEIALAGKGFNQEVENAYKQSGTLDYGAIDAIEAQTIPTDVLRSFLEEGRLAMGDQ